MPDGPTICRVHSLAKKHKEGSDYAYIEVVLKPAADVNPDLETFKNRNLWMNMSFNPKALFNMKAFAKACGLAWTKQGVNWAEAREKLVSVNLGTEPAFNNPERKVNVVKMPYNAVR
jgi:hypothetical protein